MATIKFEAVLGAAIRGQVIREIKRFCFEQDFELRLDEDKGFLVSTVFVKIEVPDECAQGVSDSLNEFFTSMSSPRSRRH